MNEMMISSIHSCFGARECNGMKRMVTMGVLLVVVGMFADIGFAAEMEKILILSTNRTKRGHSQSVPLI